MLGERSIATANERALLLRAVDTLAGVDDAGLIRLANEARFRRWGAGEVLREPDTVPSAAHTVVTGTVEARSDSQTYTAGGPGRGLGYLSVLAPEHDRSRWIATAPSTTLEIPAPALRAAYEDNFSLLRHALRVLARSRLRRRGGVSGRPAGETQREPPRSFVERVLSGWGGLFGEDELEASLVLCRYMRVERWSSGETLWREGDEPSAIVRIESGRVRCGNDVASAGMTLGAFDGLADVTRACDATAETDVVAGVLDQAKLIAILDTHRRVGIALLRTLAAERLQWRA